MNKQRRTEIQDVMDKLTELRDQVECIQNDEQEAFDNLPEGIQASDKGSMMEEAVNSLQDALDGIDEAVSGLENAQAN